jgi:hypothetical protein
MTASTPGRARTITLRSADGVEVLADLHEPADPPPHAGVVLSPPHPHFGGDRHHPLLVGLAETLAAAGMLAIRHDYHPGPADTVAERIDLTAAVAVLRDGRPALPVAAIGYSFGSLVALGTAADQTPVVGVRLDALIAVAPPLRPGQRVLAGVAEPPALHLIVPRHDQFCPPPTLEEVEGLERATIDVVEGADHFLAGHLTDVIGLAVAATRRLLGIADVG